MDSLGKTLVVAGLVLAGLGLLIWLGPGRERGSLLPGDVFIQRGNLKVYFPIVTCLALSVALTLLLWLFRK